MRSVPGSGSCGFCEAVSVGLQDLIAVRLRRRRYRIPYGRVKYFSSKRWIEQAVAIRVCLTECQLKPPLGLAYDRDVARYSVYSPGSNLRMRFALGTALPVARLHVHRLMQKCLRLS